MSSPKDTVFPETIPEESSGAEDEHVVNLRLQNINIDLELFDKWYIFIALGNIQITIFEWIRENAWWGKRSVHHIRSKLHEVMFRNWAQSK